MRMEKCNKHEAILKAKTMLGHETIKKAVNKMTTDYQKLFAQFQANIKSEKVKNYLESRNLDHKKIEIGYNAQTWISLKHCLIFPLRNPLNQIVSFYGRSIYDKENAKHFYLKNRTGLYPSYPKAKTKALILTEAIIDASTMEAHGGIKNDTSILALYGTNGLTEEHQEAIKSLEILQEIILFFDGDEAGRKAVEKWTPVLRELQPKAKISYVNTPEGEDVNSLSQSHEKEIFQHLLNERIEINPEPQDLFSSIEKRKTATNGRFVKEQSDFDSSNPKNLNYKGKAAYYYIKGGIKNGLDSMKIALQIINSQGEDYRSKLDLYEYKQVSAVAKIAADKLQIIEDQIEKDLSRLTGHLEEWRAVTNKKDDETIKVEVPPEVNLKCSEFLKRANLLQEINKLIGKAGIIGEEESRIFLFVIASSYKMEDTLHALVQGSSGSGKTHLITKLASMMPSEDTIGLTRITDSSLYNYGEYELQNKLIVLEDLDGLKEDAFLAFRELQSRGILTSSTSVKDDSGNIRSQIRTVRGPITTLSATTKGEIYEDNMSRCFLLAVNESDAQTAKIIEHQCDRASGKINKTQLKKITTFVQNCMRLLKPHEVINPFADKIKLPPEAHKIRRLNELFQSFVRQVTLINQYQRAKDKQGRLITAKEDIQVACEIMFESIVLKVDELDGSLRQFFEDLKSRLQSKDAEFRQREIRQGLRISKTQLQRYIQDLIELEYIQQTGGSPNRGYSYKISYWDNIEKLRNQIKTNLQDQLLAL